MDVKNTPNKLHRPKVDGAKRPMMKKRRTIEIGTEDPPLYTSEAEEVKDKQLNNSRKSVSRLNLSCITHEQSLMKSRHNKKVKRSIIGF